MSAAETCGADGGDWAMERAAWRTEGEKHPFMGGGPKKDGRHSRLVWLRWPFLCVVLCFSRNPHARAGGGAVGGGGGSGLTDVFLVVAPEGGQHNGGVHPNAPLSANGPVRIGVL